MNCQVYRNDRTVDQDIKSPLNKMPSILFVIKVKTKRKIFRYITVRFVKSVYKYYICMFSIKAVMCRKNRMFCW